MKLISTALVTMGLLMSSAAMAQDRPHPPRAEHHQMKGNPPDKEAVEACYLKAGAASPYQKAPMEHMDHGKRVQGEPSPHHMMGNESLTDQQRIEVERCFREKGIHIPRPQPKPMDSRSERP